DGFEALDEAGAGEGDGFEQVALLADGADAGEVGADVAADVADGVATGAGGLGAVENELPASDVAGGEIGDEPVEMGLLLGGVGGEAGAELFDALVNSLAEVFGGEAEGFGADRGEGFGFVQCVEE